jgi:hypothetical protein
MKHRTFFAACIAIALATAASPAPADGKGKPFGAACEKDGDCASGACNKGKRHAFCSLRCSADEQCPTPPTAGACNDRGFCKR